MSQKTEDKKREPWYQRLYTSTLRWSLAHRAATLAIAVVLFFGSFTLIPIIGTAFIPGMGEKMLTIDIEMPPGTPAALQATAFNSLSINLTWDGSGVVNELGFVIERKIWGGTYITIATLGPDENSYYDATGLEPEQTYTYRIWSYNSEGDSGYSNEASATTLSWQDGDATCE